MALSVDDEVVAAARAGDETAFAAIFERHQKELQVHCYRMLGSLDESEDVVQETFLRAWRKLREFQGRSTIRAWLYRIATNACLDTLESRTRRVLPHQLAAPTGPDVGFPPRTDIPWLQPFPDRLLESAAPVESEPDAVVVARETMELAFVATIQYLPPRQRAVLILRDVLGVPAKEIGALMGWSVASVNSALQRARRTIKEHLPERRTEWAPSGLRTEREQALVRRYMDAMERASVAELAELMAEDVRATMPPYPMWLQGREANAAALAMSLDATSPAYVGSFRMVPTRANGQPAAAAYVRGPGDPDYSAWAIVVFRIADDTITELTAFVDPSLFPAFELPAVHR